MLDSPHINGRTEANENRHVQCAHNLARLNEESRMIFLASMQCGAMGLVTIPGHYNISDKAIFKATYFHT